MHTRGEAGFNLDLVNNLKTSFTWKPPFSLTTDEDKDDDSIHAQPEDFTLDELDKQLQKEKEQQLVVDNDRGKVLEGEVYDLAELEKFDHPVSLIDTRLSLLFTDIAHMHSVAGGIIPVLYCPPHSPSRVRLDH
jgi:hypothetical protein